MIEQAVAKGLFIATAESLTAGQLSSTIADTPGASKVLLGGMVSYQDAVKTQLLGVSAQLIASQSAVDPEVAIQMAAGIRSKLANATGVDSKKVIGISTTGVAGPDPVGSKPVGEVYIGISSEAGERVYAEHFAGSRAEIRSQVVVRAIEILREEIGNF